MCTYTLVGFDGYLTNRTINGQVAQQESGTTIVLEHRFYGLSNPLPDLSTQSLRLHTIQQAIDDLEYFAQNVKLPQLDGDSVAPGKAPWVLIGGSYSGALTSFTVVKYALQTLEFREGGYMLMSHALSAANPTYSKQHMLPPPLWKVSRTSIHHGTYFGSAMTC